MVANAAEFLALASLKRDKVEVNGAVVHVREMTVKERSELLDLVNDKPSLVPAFLVRCCAIAEDGTQLFSESDKDALEALSPTVVDAVGRAVMQVSGMRDDPNA